MAKQIPEIVQNQKIFFASGVTKDTAFRIAQLKNLHQALITHEKALLDALHADLKKPAFEAYTSEIYLIRKEINYALKKMKKWCKPQRKTTSTHLFPGYGYTKAEPYGVVLIIAPWNYPLYLTLVPLVGALAAGNCAIIKPSEHAPHTATTLTQLINNIFDPAYITVIKNGKATAQTLLEQSFDYIFFTGSTRVGKIIMHAAAEHLTPLTLELGGKSPCIVHNDASISCAAKRIVWGKFLNAGQSCISPDYVLVHYAVKNKLIKQLKHWINTFYGTDPIQSPDYARIINEKHFDRLINLLEQGTVITGGETRRNDLYIAPTIMENISLDNTIMQEEIFGPILPIIPYRKLDEALAFINKKPKPLTLYLFSNNKNIQHMVIRNTSSGGMCINDTLLHTGSTKLPFGGVGLSGFGAYHGKTSFDTFSHYKTVFKNTCWFDSGIRYPPYGTRLKRWIRALLRWL